MKLEGFRIPSKIGFVIRGLSRVCAHHVSCHKYRCTTENWCKGKNYDKQPEKQKYILCGPHNEKHIRALRLSTENNRRTTVITTNPGRVGVPVDVTRLLRILSQMTESHRHWKVEARGASGTRQESNRRDKDVIGCRIKYNRISGKK